MNKREVASEVLPTIWRVPDELWTIAEPIVRLWGAPPAARGRGVPMATIVTAANVNDHTALPELLDARIAVAPPRVERRRWPVERTHAWHNRFRRLLIRWEKKAENWLALIHLANALIAFRACYW